MQYLDYQFIMNAESVNDRIWVFAKVSGLMFLTGLASLTLVPIVAVFWGTPKVSAQASEPCFMVDSSGRQVNLSSLCTAAPPSGTDRGVFQARIKRRIGGAPIVDVTFNGDRTFEMIVDTGASGTLITRSMADTLQVEPVGKVRAIIADGSQVEFAIGNVQSIAVAGATANNVRVAIADKAEIGLLGHDFFGNYDVQLKRDVVEFYRR